jgi:hypothetical protein
MPSLTNGGAERTGRLEMAGRAADVLLPGDPVTTLHWREKRAGV